MVAVIGLLIAGSMAAQATVITFTFSSTNESGDGYSGKTVTVTATANTADLPRCDGFVAYDSDCSDQSTGALTGHVSLSDQDLGTYLTGTFCQPVYVYYDYVNDYVGFGNGDYGDLMEMYAPTLGSSHDLTTSAGPLTSDDPADSLYIDGYVDTSFGELSFFVPNDTGSITTFTATTSGSVSVPEPGALGLFGLDLFGIPGLAAIKHKA